MKTTLYILLFLALAWNTANAQIGIGTTTPDPSSILDVTATDKGFLPPRLTTAQRDAIASPAEGLVIYNTTVNCLQWYNGTGWFDACDGSTAVPPVTGIPGNATCTTATISVTPCSAVPGATLSASQPHADGTLYDWTDATSYMGGTTTEALVEIGGQCWFRRNTTTPSPYVDGGFNDFDGYYNNATSEPAVGEGRLYQWDAAMNGSTTERSQGVCPTGWHVPSDCEWMYLENTLGMTVAEQEATGFRGTEGQDLSTLVPSGTNSSGFTALFAGNYTNDPSFANRGITAGWWTSTSNATSAVRRDLISTESGVFRNNQAFSLGLSIRCLRD